MDEDTEYLVGFAHYERLLKHTEPYQLAKDQAEFLMGARITYILVAADGVARETAYREQVRYLEHEIAEVVRALDTIAEFKEKHSG